MSFKTFEYSFLTNTPDIPNSKNLQHVAEWILTFTQVKTKYGHLFWNLYLTFTGPIPLDFVLDECSHRVFGGPESSMELLQ